MGQAIVMPPLKEVVRKDIISVLNDVIEILKTKETADFVQLSRLSNHTIHDASIYQDEDSLSIAVLVYALSKLIKRCCENEHEYPKFVSVLIDAKNHLEKSEVDEYRSAIKKIFNIISEHDKKLKLYFEEVIHNARIRKASKLHEHGISVAKTAELLGLSQWELRGYVGQQFTPEVKGVSVRERLNLVREMFK